MAAQRTEKEETEFKPETPLTPLSLPTPSVTVPPRKFRYAVSPSKPHVKTLPETVEDVPVTEKREVRRCAGCRKKVGLTGFRCRCGDLFCSEHRYSDRHVCGFDYKAAGREAIAKENPLVKAAKIIRL